MPKTPALCWSFFTAVDPLAKRDKKVRCNLCKIVMAEGGGTKSMNRHLERIHEKKWLEAKKQRLEVNLYIICSF